MRTIEWDEDFLQEVSSNVDLVEYIGQDIELKPKGKDYFGRCSRHIDKTPSFSVNKEKNMYYWSNDSGKLQTQMSWGNIGSYVTDTTVETLEDGTEIEKEEAIKLYWRVKDSDAPYNDSKVVDKVSGSSVNPYNQHMGNSIYDEEQEAYTSINASNYRDYFDGPYLTMSVSGDKVTLSNRICETNPDGTFTKAFEEVDGIRIRCEYNAYPLKHLQLVSIFNELLEDIDLEV